MTKHIIYYDKDIIEALKQLNDLSGTEEPLVLFVINEQNKLVGTLTDGDIRRAVISGKNLSDKIFLIMQKSYSYLKKGFNDNVENIQRLRNFKITLVPVLDDGNQIVEIINLLKRRSKLPIDAILMAGGKGIRLMPLTEKIPKPLLKVGDKSIIDHNVDRLIDYGIKNISVTVNYLAEQLEEHYSIPRNDIKIQCIHEPKFLGTIGAVQFVPRIINNTVLIMNSDLFTNIDYEDFYLDFKNNDADMSVAAVPYSVSVPYGIFELEGRNIIGVKEKPLYNYFANAGIYLFKKSVLEFIPQNEFFNATDLIEKLISLNKTVIRYPITGFWLDIGNKEEYAKANELIKHIN